MLNSLIDTLKRIDQWSDDDFALFVIAYESNDKDGLEECAESLKWCPKLEPSRTEYLERVYRACKWLENNKNSVESDKHFLPLYYHKKDKSKYADEPDIVEFGNS